jgi:S-methylmethionine-dependent homocysteine/selenocysteine methylase
MNVPVSRFQQVLLRAKLTRSLKGYEVMAKRNFVSCYQQSSLILTEGAVGLRISHEFGITPDNHIKNASLIYSSVGRNALEIIYRQYLQVAEDFSLPIMLMTNTRRTNKDTIIATPFRDKNVIADYAGFLRELAVQYDCETYVGGIAGCRGDAYTGEGSLSIENALSFHEWQINEFEKAGVDFVFEAIMPAVKEIIGMSMLIESRNIPYIISFMIKQNGKIIDGHTIHDAIKQIDASLQQKPLCYMANCVHPDIAKNALLENFNNTSLVKTRFKGIQANAACAEPDELDSLHEVKSSNPDELANSVRLLNDVVSLKICGGCCGTDDTHIKKIAEYLC